MVMTPGVGDRAPEFALPGTEGEGLTEYRLTDQLEAGPVVLAFYAFDFHPSCTEEMCDLRDLEWFGLDDRVTAVGLSTDRAFSHGAFAAEYGLDFPLLSDSDGSVSETYGVLYDEVNGHRRVSKRAVFVVDTDREIRYRWVADSLAQQPDWLEVQASLPVAP
ncbi:MAG: redoxin domain-containing protein [Halobacteriales archaeon]|nr:redoxin domain-containing protein [Halobacteriales archaeon]